MSRRLDGGDQNGGDAGFAGAGADTSEPRVYRGASMEEILPRIREELGPDAVITRRREGIVGGVGGFFGKRCLEVEALAPMPPVARAAVPAQSVVDVYDGGGSGGVGWTEAPRSGGAGFAGAGAGLMDDLLAQAAPFAELLGEAIERVELNGNGHVAAAPQVDDDVRRALARAAVPAKVADALLTEATTELALFAPDEPLRDHVRYALARRVRVKHRGRKRRRVLALVGPAAAGKTAATLSLCAAHARTGAKVAALSLESARRAVDLAVATDALPIAVELADSPEAVQLVRSKLRGLDLVVADTPAADPADRASIEHVAALVAALQPSETHLVVPAGAPAEAARLLLAGLRERGAVDALLIADGVGVGVSLWAGVPVSYVATHAGLRPAEPDELARLVVP
jgi:hypothetical protein